MAEERQTRQIVVFEGEGWGDGMPPDDLVGVVRWFRGKLAEVPKEYRKEASCCIGSQSGYEGSTCPTIMISYSRPETDFERAERLIIVMGKARIKREYELGLMRKLQEKYGDQEA